MADTRPDIQIQLGVDSNLSGVAANSAFFLVQIPYGNEVTSGQFFLLWEER